MDTELTTLALPPDLMAAVDKVVQEGRARSRDELVESAVRRELTELRRSALDAEFRHMADDIDYQSEAHQILGEFAQADWETLREDAYSDDCERCSEGKPNGIPGSSRTPSERSDAGPLILE